MFQDEETWQSWVKANSITEKIATGVTLPVPALCELYKPSLFILYHYYYCYYLYGVGVAQWTSHCLSCGRPGINPWLLPLRPLYKALTYTCSWGHISMVPQHAQMELIHCKTYRGFRSAPLFGRLSIKFNLLLAFMTENVQGIVVQQVCIRKR